MSLALLLVLLVSSAPLALLLLLLRLLLLRRLLLALISFGRSCAVSTGPKLTIVGSERTVLVANEDALDDHRLLGFDGVKEVFACLVSGDVLGQGDLLRELECNRSHSLAQLASFVVAPAVDGGFLKARGTHLVDFALELGALVLICDAKGVLHEVVVGRSELSTDDTAILDHTLAVFESDLAHPDFEAPRVPILDSRSHAFLKG